MKTHREENSKDDSGHQSMLKADKKSHSLADLVEAERRGEIGATVIIKDVDNGAL